MFRVIIAGGRDFHDTTWSYKKLDRLLQSRQDEDIVIVSGTANGADKVGESYAVSRGHKLNRFPADWNKFGKSAGYKRNQQMAENAEALVAFWDGQSKGTKHMIDLAKAKGLIVRVIKYSNN